MRQAVPNGGWAAAFAGRRLGYDVRREIPAGMVRVVLPEASGKAGERMGGRMYGYLLSIPRGQHVPPVCWRRNGGSSVGPRRVNTDLAARIAPARRCRIEASAGPIRA